MTGQEYQELGIPEGWTPLDPYPRCGCTEIGIGFGGPVDPPEWPATFATCQRCGWQVQLTNDQDEERLLRSLAQEYVQQLPWATGNEEV